jgi:hypothetical protein
MGTPLPKRISVGLETSAPKRNPPSHAGGRHPARENPQDQESGQEMGQEMGGSGHGRGRRGGMGGKHEGTDSEERFEPLDLWIRVTLSARSGQP